MLKDPQRFARFMEIVIDYTLTFINTEKDLKLLPGLFDLA